MIVLTAGYPVTESDICPFTDVEISGPGSLYPDNYVAVAAAHGITVGTAPGLFSPEQHISRYQVLTMVVRTADALQPGLLPAPVVRRNRGLGRLSHSLAERPPSGVQRPHGRAAALEPGPLGKHVPG
jgi:hypothetical protein